MVILRIWHPSQVSRNRDGYSAISIVGVWGAAHISTRPRKDKVQRPGASTGVTATDHANTTLEEDMLAEGRVPPHMWFYSRMDESRMLRLWDGMKGDIAEVAPDRYLPATSFRVSDLILAAGRGLAVEESPVASFTRNALGMVTASAVATDFVQLQGRADHMAHVGHW
jgi:hypothetical protein